MGSQPLLGHHPPLAPWTNACARRSEPCVRNTFFQAKSTSSNSTPTPTLSLLLSRRRVPSSNPTPRTTSSGPCDRRLTAAATWPRHDRAQQALRQRSRPLTTACLDKCQPRLQVPRHERRRRRRGLGEEGFSLSRRAVPSMSRTSSASPMRQAIRPSAPRARLEACGSWFKRIVAHEGRRGRHGGLGDWGSLAGTSLGVSVVSGAAAKLVL